MSNEIKVPIPSRVYNAATGGHVTGAEDIDFGQKVKHLVKYDHSGNEVSFASQLSAQNTIYVIHDDFTLTENVTVPANCVLEFDGGSISAGSGQNMDTITGANTGINAGLVKIFNTNITLAGSWNVAEAYPEWFGAKGNGVTDDSSIIQKTVNLFKTIKFTKHYIINNPVLLSDLNNRVIKGDDASVIESTTLATIFYALGASNITFDNLTFEGNRQEDRTYTWPLQQNAAIIFNSYCNNNVIKNCKISNFNYGVCLGTDYSSNNIIRNNTFINNNSDIDTYGTPVIVEYNISRGCTGKAIQIESYSLHEDIEDYTDYSTSPISVASRIANNTIMDCVGTAITIFEGGYSTQVLNNTIINYHEYGIIIKGDTWGTIVSGNIIKNFAGEESTAADSRAINEVSAIISYGNDCKIDNNLIIGAQNGLRVENATCYCKNNTIINSLHCGITTNCGHFTSNFIKDAGCSNNGWWGNNGVYIYAGNSSIIFDDLTVIATSKSVKKNHNFVVENAGTSSVIINNSYFEGYTSSAVSGNAVITNSKRMFGVGTTRPTLTASDAGFCFFDKTNNVKKPIWWDGTQWIDATGTPV